MKKNMGGMDKIIRLIIAAIIIVLFFMDVLTGIPGIVFLVIAGIFIVTSIFGVCPLYLPFGLTTCPKEEPSKKE